MIAENKRKLLLPKNPRFCVKSSNAWDQRSEDGYTKEIEDQFQLAINRILTFDDLPENVDISEAITKFYCLWNIRHVFSKQLNIAQDLDCEPEIAFDINEQEELEKSHVIFVNRNGEIPGNTWKGLLMQKCLWQAIEKMDGIRWGLLKVNSNDIELLAPDIFSTSRIVPVNPYCCLAAEENSKNIDKNIARKINDYARKDALEYWFSRDLSVC